MSQNANQRESFLNNTVDQFKEVPVQQLSGDEGTQKTVIITFRNEGKASNIYPHIFTDLFQTSATVINTVVGAGIIAMPYTVSVMGWIFSIIVCILVGVVNNYTILILLKAKNLSKHSTYNSISYHISRSKYLIFIISFVNMFSNVGFGKAVAMLSILKSSFRKLIFEVWDLDPAVQDFYLQEWFIAVVISIAIIPTILVKKIESLRIFSIVGVVAIVVAIAAVIIIFFVQMEERNWENNFTMMAWPKQGLPVLSVFPNILFALVWQTNFFSIYKGLKNSTDSRIKAASAWGVGFSTVLYIMLGIMGYALWGKDDAYIQTNFLLQLIPKQLNIILYVSIYLGFLVSDLFCIPVTFLVARNNLIAMIKILIIDEPYKLRKPKTLTQQSAIQQISSFVPGESQQYIRKKAQILFYVYTLGLYVTYVLITVLVQSLAAVFNIVGAVASTGISFIIPFLFYIILISRKKKPKTINYYLSIIGIIISLPLGILSIISLYI